MRSIFVSESPLELVFTLQTDVRRNRHLDVDVHHHHDLLHVELATPQSIKESLLRIDIDVLEPELVLILVLSAKASLM